MSDRQDGDVLSKRERQYIEMIVKYSTLKQAAESLGVKPQSLYNWLYCLKKRYKQRRRWVNTILAQTRRSDSLRRILSERKPLSGLDKEDLE
jgi:FixJ family two-component response regulator